MKFLILQSLLLTSCASNFKKQLKVSIEKNKLSNMAKIKKFNVIYTDLQTQVIDYDYFSLLGSYEKYTRNKRNMYNNKTASIILELMKSLGYEEVEYESKDEHNIILFKELIGWDFGDIVKYMAICTHPSSIPVKSYRCAEFKEDTFFNTHPTRELVANNLMAILLTDNYLEKLDKEKYRLVK